MMSQIALLLICTSVITQARLFVPPTIQLLPLSNITLSLVKNNLQQSANGSWEIGTMAEALTELSWPSLSVFAAGSIPPPAYLNYSVNASDVLRIANTTVQYDLPSNLTSSPLTQDESVGDPASLGVAVLLANWTRSDLNDTIYSDAANDQLNYLLYDAPRTPDGAISHRADQVQLWSDFIYMAPPFIAYYAALQNNATLMQAAFNQCEIYRSYLLDNTTGLWRHISLGSWQDNTLWATGNAWAAAGMLRVLKTMKHSELNSQFTSQEANLTSWVEEIVNSTWIYQGMNGTLFNAINDTNSFGDSASTALMAAVTYRLAVLTGDNTTHIANANSAYDLVSRSIDDQGWLRNTVDPLTFNTPSATNTSSPEGQAFVLLMEAARRDFVQFAQNGTFSMPLKATEVQL